VSSQLYDEIGVGYAAYRRPDARIATAIAHALGDAESVVNVGAGAGSYEPVDRRLVAVEPSSTMLRQRPPGSAPALQASALALPFADGSFAASLAILTMHHWPDPALGARELRRVARDRVVILSFDTQLKSFWLIEDYFPEIADVDRASMPSLASLRAVLGEIEVRTLRVPHDCSDGFLGAYWRRPEAYLDAGVRSAISSFARIGDVEPGLARLRADLADGSWQRRNAALQDEPDLDIGYRLVIASTIAS
jgi:SAM-dependent methyltransferase